MVLIIVRAEDEVRFGPGPARLPLFALDSHGSLITELARRGVACPLTMPGDPTSPTSPLAPFPPLPPPEFRSRAPEFYGFVAWTSTSLGFVIYVLWALLPDDIILLTGISWYPNRLAKSV